MLATWYFVVSVSGLAACAEIGEPTAMTHLIHSFLFFNDTATTEIYTLSLHDALPILTQGTLAALSRRRPNHPSRTAGRIHLRQQRFVGVSGNDARPTLADSGHDVVMPHRVSWGPSGASRHPRGAPAGPARLGSRRCTRAPAPHSNHVSSRRWRRSAGPGRRRVVDPRRHERSGRWRPG